VEIARNNPQVRADVARELIDGGASDGEVGDHLDGDLRRVGGDALPGDAVIAGKYQRVHPIETGRVSPLPAGEPGDDFFQAPEAAGRFGELGLARGDGGCGRAISGGQTAARRAQVFESGEAGIRRGRHYRDLSSAVGRIAATLSGESVCRKTLTAARAEKERQ
jgi:hypothetical protein